MTVLATGVIATVEGKPLTELPHDLFIPPDALEVLLESFSGPLDLLLYLIQKEQVDILDIPITRITEQYMQYIALLEHHRLELAADYLVMAAMLAEIKSRLLLPPVINEETQEDVDPRLDLVRKLQRYEAFKQRALALDNLPRYDRDIFGVALLPNFKTLVIEPVLTLDALITALHEITARDECTSNYQIFQESLSIHDYMASILSRLQNDKQLAFSQLILPTEGRPGLCVQFLAILELTRQTLISCRQALPFSPIYLALVDYDA